MAAHEVFARVEADLDAGELWRARDRLHGYLASRPAGGDPARALELLGDVYLRMGDPPTAGRYLYFTESLDPAHEAARAAFRERFGRSDGGVAAALPRRPMMPDLGPRASERLATAAWDPEPPTVASWTDPEPLSVADRLALTGCAVAFVGVVIAPWVLGLLWVLGAL